MGNITRGTEIEARGRPFMKKRSLGIIVLCAVVLCAALSGCGRREEQEEGSAEEQITMVTGYIDLGTARIYYEEQGSGRPLVMLHGGLLDATMWDPQFGKFARHFRVIRYDARGHGRSVCQPDTFSYHEDLHAIVEKLGLEKPILVGHSMGGYAAIDFALEYPEVPAALVLVSPGLSGFEFKSPAFEEFRERFGTAAQSGEVEEMAEAFLTAWTDGPRRRPGEIDPAIRQKLKAAVLENMTNWEERNVEYRPLPFAIDRLGSLRVPVLVVTGDLDMTGILEIARLVQIRVPRSQTIMISDAAHMINLEKPEEFNRIALQFLDALPTAQEE